jgi:hypothetical protein
VNLAALQVEEKSAEVAVFGDDVEVGTWFHCGATANFVSENQVEGVLALNRSLEEFDTIRVFLDHSHHGKRHALLMGSEENRDVCRLALDPAELGLGDVLAVNEDVVVPRHARLSNIWRRPSIGERVSKFGRGESKMPMVKWSGVS